MFSLDDPLIKRISAVLRSVDMCDDSHIPKRDGQRPATVLMPLIKRDEWKVLLTRRPMHMPTHPGQISFPGGRTEAGETPCQGALRETHEEVGIAAPDIHLLGRLPSFNAVSEFRVTPFVGIINPSAEIIPCANEVEETIEIPFEFFMNTENHIPRTVEFEGVTHQLYDMPWPDVQNPTWHVWGMTAMMMYRLYQRMDDERMDT
ncbi:CoA pyrophosphatase [bacterium AH-315-J23]|nr:CoA pyrophosphatase [bacterium AH-315-J23]